MAHLDDGLLHTYLDGECSATELANVERHLEGCGNCRDRLQSSREFRRQASALLSELDPGPLRAPPLPEIEHRAQQVRAVRADQVRRLLGWAAMILIAFGLGWYGSALQRSVTEPAAAPLVAADARIGERAMKEQREAEERLAAEQPRESSSTIQQSPALLDQVDRTGALPADQPLERADNLEAPDQPFTTDRDMASEALLASAETRGEQDEVKAPKRPASRSARRPRQPSKPDQPAQNEDRRQESLARPVDGQTAGSETDATGDLVAKRRVSNRIVDDLEAAAEVGSFAQGAGVESLAGGKENSRLVGADGEAASDGYAVAVSIIEATAWLGAPLRRLPDLELVGSEVGPGALATGGLATRPAVRLRYRNAAGNEFQLLQQYLGPEFGNKASQPALIPGDASQNACTWLDSAGYRIILSGPVEASTLLALANSVR